LKLARFHFTGILLHIGKRNSSLSQYTTICKNHSGWSFQIFSKSWLYFSHNLRKIACQIFESLHGRIASLSGEFGSMILSKST
jgi:hypothetical protein